MRGWQSTFVLGLLVILAGSTAYFASRSSYLEKQVQLHNSLVGETTTPTDTPSTTSAVTSPVVTPTTSASAPATPAAATPEASSSTTSNPGKTADVVTVAAADRLSQPSETYKVVQGDTLYAISLKQNISQDKLAQVNNLKDPFPLKIGQTLIIPNVDGKQNIFEVDYTFTTDTATADQQATDSGKNTWRLNPATVALAENGGAFGLSSSDQYQVATSDTTNGTATVTVTHTTDNQAKTYTVSLSQPVKKGAAGIWTITKISPANS